MPAPQNVSRATRARCGGPRCIRSVADLDWQFRRLQTHQRRAHESFVKAALQPSSASASVGPKGRGGPEPCACQDGPGDASPWAEPSTTSRPRLVESEWLVTTMRLGEQLRGLLRGAQVQLDEEIWGALMATRRARTAWSTTRRKVARRRAAIWPRTKEQRQDASARPIKGEGRSNGTVQPGSDLHGAELDLCGCLHVHDQTISLNSLVRYVDSALGDDANSGSFSLTWDATTGTWRMHLHPWKSLRRVEHWLNVELWEGRSPAMGHCVEGAEVYLRCGRTWDGSEEPSAWTSRWVDAPDVAFDWTAPEPNEFDKEPILSIRDFKATEQGPLTLSCYPPPGTVASGSSGGLPKVPSPLPLIDGVAGSVYGAPRADGRTGILMYSCCHVYISHLRIRGFGGGIEASHASKHHLYQNLEIYDCSGGGIGFGNGDKVASMYYGYDTSLSDGELDAIFDEMGSDGFYPEDIVVDSCELYSIGYDTANQDIGIGFLSTNCTVTGCTLTGDEIRGIDGIIFNGASSGHLIERNRISNHNKYCKISGDCRAMFVDGGLGAILLDPCGEGMSSGGDVTPFGTSTPYGYTIQVVPACPITTASDGMEAFGENGIDMKGARVRTTTSESSIHIRENVIWGHPVFSGIAVADSSENVHIYRNKIFSNATGISVANGGQSTWYNYGTYYERPTSRVYVYRNQIYANSEYGVQVVADYDSVYRLEVDTGAKAIHPVSKVYILGNTIAHNLWEGVKLSPHIGEGIDLVFLFNNLIARNGYLRDERQIRWDAGTPPAIGAFWSDYNVWLGWDDSSKTKPESRVCWVGGWDGTASDAADHWGVEKHGQQATFLGDLDLVGSSDIEALEGVYIDLSTPLHIAYWGG